MSKCCCILHGIRLLEIGSILQCCGCVIRLCYICGYISFPELQTNYPTDTPKNAKLSLGESIFTTVLVSQIIFF